MNRAISQPLIDKVSAALRKADDNPAAVPYEVMAIAAITTVIDHVEGGGK